MSHMLIAFFSQLRRLLVGGGLFAVLLAGLYWLAPAQASGQQATVFTTVSAGSYRFDSIAPESIVAGFGANLSTETAAGRDSDATMPGIQLPTTLVGTPCA